MTNLKKQFNFLGKTLLKQNNFNFSKLKFPGNLEMCDFLSAKSNPDMKRYLQQIQFFQIGSLAFLFVEPLLGLVQFAIAQAMSQTQYRKFGYEMCEVKNLFYVPQLNQYYHVTQGKKIGERFILNQVEFDQNLDQNDIELQKYLEGKDVDKIFKATIKDEMVLFNFDKEDTSYDEELIQKFLLKDQIGIDEILNKKNQLSQMQ